MKKYITLALVAATGTLALAQPNSAVPKNIRAANTLDNLFDANGLASFDNLYGIPLEPGKVVGNSYLNADWKRTTFMLYDTDKMIEGYHARYEIEQDQFEIKAAGGIKVLSGRKVKSFVWVDSLSKSPHYFVNGKDLRGEGQTQPTGFYEVLTEGGLTLLAKTDIVVKEPTYNEKLDMGQRDTRIVKKTAFFYIDNNVMKELPSSRKKLLPLFGQHEAAIEEFIKLNKLSLNQSGHLRAVFEHYNAMTVTN
jgi:hypothetical protein